MSPGGPQASILHDEKRGTIRITPGIVGIVGFACSIFYVKQLFFFHGPYFKVLYGRCFIYKFLKAGIYPGSIGRVGVGKFIETGPVEIADLLPADVAPGVLFLSLLICKIRVNSSYLAEKETY